MYYRFWKKLKKKNIFLNRFDDNWLDKYSQNFKEYSSKHFKILLGAALTIIFVLFIVFIPKQQAVNAFENEQITYSEIPTFENDFRVTLAQIIGGVLLLIGLYLTNKRIKASEIQAESALKQVKISKQSQEVEAFSRAIEQLSSKEFYNQLGALSTLEQLAKKREEYSQKLILIIASILKIETNKKENKNQNLIDASFKLLENLDKYAGKSFTINLDKINGSGLYISIYSSKFVRINLSTTDNPSGINISLGNGIIELRGNYKYSYFEGSIETHYSKFVDVSFGLFSSENNYEFYSCNLVQCEIENFGRIRFHRCALKEMNLEKVKSVDVFDNILAVFDCELSPEVQNYFETKHPELLTKENYEKAEKELSF